ATEELEALQTQVEHPLRLVLLRGDVTDHGVVDAADRTGAGVGLVGPAVLVAADARQLRVELFDGGHRATFLSVACRVVWWVLVAVGMQVVHTPSPWAIVASRCTWLPR